MVPASSSLTKDRESPDSAENTRMIHNRTPFRNGFSMSPIRKDPMEKLTAMSVVTANMRMALTA